jgi:hypothetical protein
MYLQNKYTRWYYKIISAAKSRHTTGYTENHHIVPKSLGGPDSNENLVSLTAREHFICHWLLTKMVEDKTAQAKMRYAFYSFKRANKNQDRYRITGSKFELLKLAASQARSFLNLGNTYAKGHVRTAEHTRKILESRAWYRPSDSVKKKQSESMKTKYATQSWTHAGKTYEEMYGAEQAEVRKNKLRGPRGPRKNPPGPQKLITCPHCDKTGGISNMKRYHFNNCPNQ